MSPIEYGSILRNVTLTRIFSRAQVEGVPEVEDSVAVGLRVEGDVQVVLFVKLASSENGASCLRSTVSRGD